ncbi:MAG: GNAT family N-acetyltransferase [Nanoarchaeota archaeon]|nr:GNAT family N-acetyltransferase [Nanoarchaeota archaeon]
MTVEIRSAEIKDLDSIYNVELNSFSEDRQADKETLRKRIELFLQGCFVLIYKDEIVGFCTGLLIDDLKTQEDFEKHDQIIHNPNGSVFYLRSLAVKKKYWGKGFGKMLVEKQTEFAKNLGKKHYRFTAARDVEGFYRKLGFRIISDYKKFHGIPQAIWEKTFN